MPKGAPRSWSLLGPLLAVLALTGCGAWFHEDVTASHIPGAPRPQHIAIVPFRATIAGGEETSPPSSYFGPHATTGCRNGLGLAGVNATLAAGYGDLADPVNLARIAKEAGADAVLVGTVDVRKFELVVDVRLLRAENGAVDATAHAEGRKDEDVLARDACKALVSGGATGR